MTYQDAVRKARFGHRDWIAYKTRSGESVYVPASAETIKAAMLASGTQKAFTLISANDGIAMKLTWWIANNVRRQFALGMR